MFIADVVSLEWEVLRWRRLKSSLIRARGIEALEAFLCEQLDYDLYSEHFADDLTEILQENLPKDQAKNAETLAPSVPGMNRKPTTRSMRFSPRRTEHGHSPRRCAAPQGERARARVRAAQPDAVTLVDELLTGAGMTMDALMAEALAKKLDDIERIDRLTTIAESRRNASLREIDRRRAVLGETLRRSVQEIEDGEFEVIETTPAKGKNAA